MTKGITLIAYRRAEGELRTERRRRGLFVYAVIRDKISLNTNTIAKSNIAKEEHL